MIEGRLNSELHSFEFQQSLNIADCQSDWVAQVFAFYFFEVKADIERFVFSLQGILLLHDNLAEKWLNVNCCGYFPTHKQNAA